MSQVHNASVHSAEGSTQEPTRRDFLVIASAAMGAVGAASVAWPLRWI
jgi:Rieske Fe-S protein